MFNYIFNGDVLTMQDILCAIATRAMAEFANVEPSYEDNEMIIGG